MRPTKADADDAITRFYCALIDMSDGDDDPPNDAAIMVKIADIRAIIRDLNWLENRS